MSFVWVVHGLSLSSLLGAIVVFTSSGCGDGFEGIKDEGASDGSAPISATDADSDADVAPSPFSLSANVSSLYVGQGEQNVALTIAITRAEGFTTPVTISVNGLPSAVHVGALTLAGGDTSGTLLFGADPSAILGGATISVLGVAGEHSAGTSLTLFVAGRMDFDADGTFVVPQVVPPTLDFYLWGGGGGGAGIYGSGSGKGHGGAGGAALGHVAVTPAEVLTIQVGGGGQAQNDRSGAGGGYTALRRGATLLLLAGGGGGGGYGYRPGGVGGGETGGNGGTNDSGRGGTATAGGLGSGTHTGRDGAAWRGGIGLGGTNADSLPGASPGGGASGSGGGGGGGFFGGGGGGGACGGGGGSGFAHDSVLAIDAVGGGELKNPRLLVGDGQTPPLTSSAYYTAGVGIGGTQGSAEGSATTT